MKLKSIFTILFLVLISCKNEGGKGSSKEIEAEQSTFTVDIWIKIEEDNVVCLYYKDNSVAFFNEKMAIHKDLKKGNQIQHVVFKLPNGCIPNDFRFDLSSQNKNQKISIERIKFEFDQKDFEILNKDFERYLKPDASVVWDQNQKAYYYKQSVEKHDDFLNTTSEFYPLLETLVGYEAFIPIKK